MANDNGEPDTYQTPSRAQELALAVLPIPSSILSIIGSSVIIYMSIATRRQRKCTPYTRLLLCLSFYDIIQSINIAMAVFLRPADTSPRPFSFGSSGTCTLVGFLNQFSYGTLIYNGSLSLYFLLTARFGYSNAYIARAVEPWMHIIGNGFAVSTSMVALVLGAYGEMTSGTGCWVANYPVGCKENGIPCKSRLMGWLYFGLPSISIFILLFIFNTMIFLFVWRHKIPIRISKAEIEDASMTKTEDENRKDEGGGSPTTTLDSAEEANGIHVVDERESQNQSSQLEDQARRLRLVSTQAFLYVFFFLFCNVWTGITGLIESSGHTVEEELHKLAKFYFLFVLQAVLVPLQGFFNMAVFIRPKLHLCSKKFPKETRLWVIRRTILGNRIKPTRSSGGALRAHNTSPDATNARKQDGANDPASATRLPRDMISSVTASEGDFDSEIPAPTGSKDERWATDKANGSILASLPIRFESIQNPKSSVLEVISENEPSTFEATSRISITEELLLEMAAGDFVPKHAESRWASDSSNPASASSPEKPLSIPQREETPDDEPDRSSSFRHLNGISEEPPPLPSDQPIRVPQRRSAPGSPSFDRKVVVNTESEEKEEMQIPADHPVKVPQRQNSLDDDGIIDDLSV